MIQKTKLQIPAAIPPKQFPSLQQANIVINLTFQWGDLAIAYANVGNMTQGATERWPQGLNVFIH